MADEEREREQAVNCLPTMDWDDEIWDLLSEPLRPAPQPRIRQSATDFMNENTCDDVAFKERFRKTRQTFRQLLTEIQPHMKQHKSAEGQRPVPDDVKLLITISYLATGSHQKVIGDRFAVSQSTVSRIIPQVTEAICHLYTKYVADLFPTSDAEIKTVSRGFASMSRRHGGISFPGVVGCVDGTLIDVWAPGLTDRELRRSRKGKIQLNVQAICNDRLLFTDVVVRHAGSVNDWRIFCCSRIGALFEQKQRRGLILGDSGYALRSFLMIPLSAPTTSAEERYHFSHIHTRNTIERAFGILKTKFAVLRKGDVHVAFDTSKTVILAAHHPLQLYTTHGQH